MKISITVYDEKYKKIFSTHKIDLQKGMYQLSGFMNRKLGLPLRVVNITEKSKRCYVCKKPIKKGQGMLFEGKKIHQACLMKARQGLP